MSHIDVLIQGLATRVNIFFVFLIIKTEMFKLYTFLQHWITKYIIIGLWQRQYERSDWLMGSHASRILTSLPVRGPISIIIALL